MIAARVQMALGENETDGGTKDICSFSLFVACTVLPYFTLECLCPFLYFFIYSCHLLCIQMLLFLIYTAKEKMIVADRQRPT